MPGDIRCYLKQKKRQSDLSDLTQVSLKMDSDQTEHTGAVLAVAGM